MWSMKSKISENWQRYQVPILVLLLAELLDMVTTLIGIHLGAVETNFLFTDYRQLLLVKAFIVLALIVYFLSRARLGESLKAWIMSIFWTLIPAWNIGVIISLI